MRNYLLSEEALGEGRNKADLDQQAQHGQQLATTYPHLIAVAQGPSHRGGCVTIDPGQNSVGRNTAAPYTLRASTPHPTVSTPIAWEELDSGKIHPEDLTPQVVLERIQRLGDLFAPVRTQDQHIP